MKKFIQLIFVLLLTYNVNAKVLMRPYLQGLTSNEILIMVETDSQEKVKINYISKTNGSINQTIESSYFKETETTPKTYVHRVVLNNLDANSEYTYSLKTNDTNYMGGFKTLIKKGESSNFTFASYGDSRSAPKIFAKITQGMISKNPDFSVYLGDLAYDGSYKLWKEEFFIPQQLEMAANVPFYNAVGNHEKWITNTQAFTDAPTCNSNDKGYYSFDCGDFHFLVLSTEQNVTKNAPQWQFAKKDLESSKAKWKIVAFHIPAYSAGAHNENKKMIAFTSEIFEKNKVDIVLTGHSHFYQHNLINGINHFVLGGGGSPLYNPKEAKYVIKSAKVYHYAIFKYFEQSLTMTVYDLENKIVDFVKFDNKK